jgi:oligogalacturonide lyase
MAVNEKTGEIVQVTEGGYSSILCVARKSMKLYFLRKPSGQPENKSVEVVEVDLGKLFTDSKAKQLKTAPSYQRVCGTTSPEWEVESDMALDGGEEWVWFRVGKDEALKHLPEGTKIEENFGPRNLGAGPSGIAGMNVNTGETKYVVSVPFRIGHIQNNPWMPGEIFFCWETGGKAPQRTWMVNSDGTGLSPVYPESDYEWITHEAVISPDEMAFIISGHSRAKETNGVYSTPESQWGPAGARKKPTGLAVINLKTHEVTLEGQIPEGNGFWHATGSADKRFVAGDHPTRNIYLINRKTHEMILLSGGHKKTAIDHPHPTFSPDGTRIVIQSAMLSEDGKSMNICIIPVPEKWLKEK